MTTEQFERLAGIIEGLRVLLAQAEDLYWEAAEAERLEGMAA